MEARGKGELREEHRPVRRGRLWGWHDRRRWGVRPHGPGSVQCRKRRMARVRDGCCDRILHWTMLCQAVIHTPYRGGRVRLCRRGDEEQVPGVHGRMARDPLLHRLGVGGRPGLRRVSAGHHRSPCIVLRYRAHHRNVGGQLHRNRGVRRRQHSPDDHRGCRHRHHHNTWRGVLGNGRLSRDADGRRRHSVSGGRHLLRVRRVRGGWSRSGRRPRNPRRPSRGRSSCHWSYQLRCTWRRPYRS